MWWRSTAQSHAESVERMEAGVEACERADELRRETSGLTPLDVCDAAKSQLEHAEERSIASKIRRDAHEVPAGWLR